MEKVKTKSSCCSFSRRKLPLKGQSSTCSKCGKTFGRRYLKNRKCPACNAEEVFLRALSSDAFHMVCSRKYSLDGGRQ